MVNRNEVIESTMRALASCTELQEAGFTYEMLDDLHTRCENLPKNDPNKIRKRSSSSRSEKGSNDSAPKRIRGGYQICDHKDYGDDDFKQSIKDYISANPGTKYMSAKSEVWNGLSSEEKAQYDAQAEDVNRKNNFEPKQESRKSSPTVTKAQYEEQVRILSEKLREHQEDIPDLPERAPPKPRKKKADKSASSSEERVESPKSAASDDLADMVNSIKLDSDDDSDDEDDGENHKKWCADKVSAMLNEEGISKSIVDFTAWLMYNSPDIYGEGKQENVSKETLKEAKKTHNFKERKNDKDAPWANFLA